MSKEYKIPEIVDIIGVSRATVYNKINSLSNVLDKYTTVRKGTKYIHSEGVEILKKSIRYSNILESQEADSAEISETKQENIDNTNDSNESKILENQESSTKYIESLESQLEYLKSIISEKDKQLGDMTRLVENSQVLQKQQQEKIFFLEQPKEQEQKRSFWDMFKRS